MLAVRLALLVEIGEEIQLRVLVIMELIQNMDLQLAKALPKLQLTLWRKIVVTEDENSVTQKGFVDLVENRIAEFGREIDTLDFRPET